MGTRPLTKRQQYWLDHLVAASESSGTLVDYAKAHKLTPKRLYQWKTRLMALGQLPRSSAAREPGFVRVATPRHSTKASLVMPNGLRLELQGTLDRHLIRELIAAVSEVS